MVKISNYMQTNVTNKREIKKVLLRKYDKLKFVVIPRKSNINAGDFVSIRKVVEVENGTA